MSDQKYEYTKQDNNEDFQIDLEIKIDPELFNQEKEKAYKYLAPNVRLKGFRAGMAPRQMIEASLGVELIEETINRILPRITSEILIKEELEPITQINYQITRVEPDGKLEYKASFTRFPYFKMTDIKKIKVKKQEIEIKKEDVEKVKKNMFEDSMRAKDFKELGFSEPNDAWVEALKMDSIKNIAELETQIEKTVKTQREVMAEDKYTLDLIKEIAKESEVKLPAKLLEKEVELQEKEYRKRVEGLGLKFDDFVRNQKIDFEQMKAGWRKEVENNFERDVVLMQIVKDNKINVSDEEVQKEVSQIEDPQLKSQFNNAEGRMNAKTVMLRQKAISWIKSQINNS